MKTFTLAPVVALSVLILTLVVVAGVLAQPASQPASSDNKVVTPSGLTIVTLARGEGAKKGDTVYVIYTGMLASNKHVFDASSMSGNVPINFTLGAGKVIKGWEEGFLGMQVGEKRHLIVPADLAYGKEGRGDRIPPNSTLEFDVELVGLVRA